MTDPISRGQKTEVIHQKGLQELPKKEISNADRRTSSIAFKVLIALAVILALPTIGLSLIIPGTLYLLYKCCCQKASLIDLFGRSKIAPEKFLKQTQEKAEQGDVHALRSLGRIYGKEMKFGRVEGDGFVVSKEDQQLAFNYYKKTAEHPKAIPSDWLRIASRYETGKGTQPNEQEAFNWYKKAADCASSISGYSPFDQADACYRLAAYYEKKIENGELKHIPEAIKYYEKAAAPIDMNIPSQGHYVSGGNVEAQIRLAQLYQEGNWEIEINEEETIKYCNLAARNGNGFLQAQAQMQLGSYYKEKNDLFKVFTYYRKALNPSNLPKDPSEEQTKFFVKAKKELTRLVCSEINKKLPSPVEFDLKKIKTIGDLLEQIKSDQPLSLCLVCIDRNLMLRSDEPIEKIAWEAGSWESDDHDALMLLKPN